MLQWQLTMRVIAGELRGRKLVAPKGLATRPTADRARQGMFDWLRPWLSAPRVLDLYAGSGALGIEALSRGATHAVFVENAPPAVEALRRNLTSLGLTERAKILSCSIERAAFAVRQSGPYDCIFCDPPWSRITQALHQIDRLMETGELLAEGGILVLEHPVELSPALGALAATDRRSWGGTGVSLFVRG